MMLHPNKFEVDEAWIVFKLNEAPISTATDGDFNVITLMDAASCFIFGAEFVPAGSAELLEEEAKRLIKTGQSQSKRLPKMLYIPDNQVAGVLCLEAERNGIAVVRVPEEQLLVFISDAREGLKEYMGGGSVQ